MSQRFAVLSRQGQSQYHQVRFADLTTLPAHARQWHPAATNPTLAGRHSNRLRRLSAQLGLGIAIAPALIEHLGSSHYGYSGTPNGLLSASGNIPALDPRERVTIATGICLFANHISIYNNAGQRISAHRAIDEPISRLEINEDLSPYEGETIHRCAALIAATATALRTRYRTVEVLITVPCEQYILPVRIGRAAGLLTAAMANQWEAAIHSRHATIAATFRAAVARQAPVEVTTQSGTVGTLGSGVTSLDEFLLSCRGRGALWRKTLRHATSTADIVRATYVAPILERITAGERVVFVVDPGERAMVRAVGNFPETRERLAALYQPSTLQLADDARPMAVFYADIASKLRDLDGRILSQEDLIA